MTLNELIREIRERLDDLERDLWSDRELVSYTQDALDTVIREARLIIDSTIVGEVLAAGTVKLAGAAGSIDSVSVNGVVITSGAVPFNTDLTTTALNLANNINAYVSSPNYTATASGDTVTIKAVAGTGSNPNGYVIAAVLSGGLSATMVDLSGGTSLCEIYVLAGINRYALDERILEVKRAKLVGATRPLSKATQSFLDSLGDWESAVETPTYFVADDDANSFILYPKPKAAGTLKLTVHRMPLKQLVYTNLSEIPEIKSRYHRKLIPGVLAQAYGKQHLGIMVDERKSMMFAKEFAYEVNRIKVDEIRRIGAYQSETARPRIWEGSNQWRGSRAIRID